MKQKNSLSAKQKGMDVICFKRSAAQRRRPIYRFLALIK